jgi:hypothetical protein
MRKLTVLTLSAAVLGATLLAPGVANADVKTAHFIMFSNRSGYAPQACVKTVKSTTSDMHEDCKNVWLRTSYAFWVSKEYAADGVRLTINDYVGHTYKHNYVPLDRDVCLRETTSGAIHEATDKPCTDK